VGNLIFTVQKVSNRFAEFDLIRALAIVSVVMTHAGFFTFTDRRILFVAIDTLQLFCIQAFLMLSGFWFSGTCYAKKLVNF